MGPALMELSLHRIAFPIGVRVLLGQLLCSQHESGDMSQLALTAYELLGAVSLGAGVGVTL